MTPDDSIRRGDPTSRPEGVFSHVLKALFGKSQHEGLRPDAPVAAGPPEPQPPIAESPPGDNPTPSHEPMFMAMEELQSLQQHQTEPRRDEPAEIAAATWRETAPLELRVLETFEEVGRHMGQEEPVAASVAVDTGVPQIESDPAPQILGELHSPSVDTRRKALERLADDPGSAPVVAVAARLQDPSPEVRLAAVGVLEATHDEAVLLLLLDAMRDPSEDVRRLAREAIGSKRRGQTVEILRRELGVPARRWAAAKVLADLGEVDELVRAAAAEGPDLRHLVREAMDDAGTTSQLIEDLNAERSDRRRIAAERLGQMRIREAVDALIERIEDPDRGVRIKAAEALGRIGDQRANHALKKAFIWDPDSGVVVAIGNAIRKLAGTHAGRTITL